MAVTLTLVVAAGAAVHHVTSKNTVELTIDGQVLAMETRADTVGALLADQGVTVTENDRVVPHPDTELTDQTAIEVRFARLLTVTIDGVERTHTTTELELGDALAAIDAPIEGAAISAALDDPLPRTGATVEIVTPKSVNVVDGGQPRAVTTTARTVDELLGSESISLGDRDTLDPAAGTAVTPGMTVTVTRVRIENEVATEAIAHPTVEQNDADLAVGTRQTATAGVDGEKAVTYAVTYTNGEVTATEEVSVTVTREPVTEVIRVGTKPAPVAAATDPGSASGAASGLNWAALAQCESSGNPRAVNPAGYYGLYQFALSTWASVGGSGNPVDASAAEQTNRAQILYERSGAGQWPTCGRKLFS